MMRRYLCRTTLYAVTTGLAALGLASCSLAPRSPLPQAEIPVAWPQGAAYAGASAPAAAAPWQSVFAEPGLQQVIDQALQRNHDLRIAAANVEQARARYRIRTAERLPSVDAGLGFERSRVPLPTSLAPVGDSIIVSRFQTDIGISAYEIDLFGRLRNLQDQALARFMATEAASSGMRITVIAETARHYLGLAADQRRLALARQTLESQQRSYDLIDSRHQAGAVTRLDVHQARTTVEAARADVAAFTARVAQGENALALLAGAQVAPGLLPDARTAVPDAVAGVPPALPSELLLRRPDVREAEFLLASADADVGAARAAFFPRITLTAAAGRASEDLSELFEAGSGIWRFFPQISVPLFRGGALQANLDAARAEQQKSVARYEQAVQVAFRETADALAELGTLGARLDSQNAWVQAASDSLALSDARYRSGADSYITVLVSQRDLYSARMRLIELEQARADALVALYRALGGGWQAPVAGQP